ncbi:uncharacterized protein LOC115996027 [Ipomoea triloba]|uniref:uncharacterized protein LOC115996027 n=1 Tax=Ipomoea triloba TaxID=35885 RepID=UPI00125DBD86|nr:uncharacterized protein LOC115996027 [Ipomoea triloba]
MEKGSSSSLSAACEALTIGDDDEGVIVEVEETPTPEVDYRFVAVGRVVTDRPVKLVIFRDVMATAWRSMKGVMVRDLGANRFLFTFYCEQDVSRVLSDGPWTFDQNLVLLRRVVNGEDPMVVPLNKAAFWVQVHKLPTGFMSEKVAMVVGNYVGEFERADKRNFDAVERTFMRVRTQIDVLKPLRAKMKMRKPGGDWFWLELRYKRFPSFCFECGIIGHSEKFCPVASDKPVDGGDKPFGSWLRAGGRRGGAPSVNRWLVLDDPIVGGSQAVTDGNHEVLMHGGQLPEVSVEGNKVVSEGGEVGVLNDLNDDGGVVFVDQKRKRVGENDGLTEWTSPMVIENNNVSLSEEVGFGSQAHRAQ